MLTYFQFTGFGLSRRRPNLGPPATKLSVSTPAQVVNRPLPPTVKTHAETAPVASTPISAQSGGKMRTRKAAPLRESAREAARIREEEEEEPITSDLTAVLMPIGSLPTFGLLPPPPSVSAPVVASTVKTSFAVTTSSNGLFSSTLTTSTPAPRPAFTFSAPLVTVSPNEAAAAISSKPPSFNFSSPLLVKPMTAKTPEKEPTIQPEVQLKTGSVLEALGSKKSQETASVVVTKQPPVATTSGFGEKFKPPSDSWTCSVCCVTNPKDKSKCVACESPGPAAPKPAVAAPVTPAPLTKGFGDQFKMSSSQWECSVCMVRNLEKDDRCKSCEEPRPGSKPKPTPPSISNFKFGVQSSTASAKFGAESTIPTTVSSDHPTTSAFSFGTKKEDASAGFKFGATVGAPKETKELGGFKFGSAMEPSKKAEKESSGFKFGATMEPAKTTETPGFKFGASMEPIKKTEEAVGDKKAEEPALPKTVSQPVVVPESTTSFSFQSAAKPKPEEPKVFDLPTLEPIKKIEAEPQTFKMPTSSSSSLAGFSMAATTTTAASKSNPIFSFGTATDSKNVTTLETGSVMDILGKKPAPAFAFGPTPVEHQGTRVINVTVADSDRPVSSAPFSFGAATEQPKPSFSFATKPATTTDKFAFGATEEPSVTKTSAVPSSSTPFSFTAGAPTSTPSLSMFKPSTVAAAAPPSFSFGGPTAFGASAAPPVFGATSTAAAAAPAFGTTTTAAPPAFGVPTTTAAPFGLATTSTVTTAPASSSGSIFSFGAATPVATSTAPSSFSFGLAPASSSSSAAPFAFSAPPPYPSFPKEAPKPAAGGFGFTAPSTAASSAAPAAPALFSFGSASAAAPATTTPSEAPKVQFSFGTPQQTTPSTAAAPSFGSFGGSATKTTTAPFTFGAASPATPAFGDMTAKSSAAAPFGAPVTTPFGPPTGATGFGAPPAASSFGAASPFSFGSSAAAPSTTFSAAPSFNFGGSAPNAAAAPQPPSVGPVFQFGSAASTTPAVNSGFSFGPTPAFTTPDAPSPGFSNNLFGVGNPFDNQGSASGPQRKIRKAIRKR